MKQRASQPGYVLMLTLLLLAVASAGLVSVGAVTLRRANESMALQDDLQRRWAARSAEATLLPRAEKLLLKAEAGAVEPVASLRVTVPLGRYRCEFLLSDEQAKVNLNAIYAPGRELRTEQAARELLRTGKPLAVRLRPLRARGNEPPLPLPALVGLGQVLPDTQPQALTEVTVGSSYALADLTLWGSGSLNLQRASHEALLVGTRDVLGAGDAGRIVQLRRQYPGLDLEAISQSLKLTPEQRAKLKDRLISGSNCHGLWTIIRGDDGRESFYSLAIMDRAAPPSRRLTRMSW